MMANLVVTEFEMKEAVIKHHRHLEFEKTAGTVVAQTKIAADH